MKVPVQRVAVLFFSYDGASVLLKRTWITPDHLEFSAPTAVRPLGASGNPEHPSVTAANLFFDVAATVVQAGEWTWCAKGALIDEGACDSYMAAFGNMPRWVDGPYSRVLAADVPQMRVKPDLRWLVPLALECREHDGLPIRFVRRAFGTPAAAPSESSQDQTELRL